MTENTATQLAIQPSENAQLSSTLMGLEQSLENAARHNLEEVLRTQGTELQAFTDLEIKAMVMTEELRLSNGIDLAALLMRGKIIKQIEEQALYSVHPNGFANLTALAKSVQISVSELSDTRALCDKVFPWVEENMGLSAAQLWDAVGKTNLRAMVPYLIACITGEEPDKDGTAANYHRMLDTTAIEMREMGEEVTDETVRRRAAEHLIQTAGEESTRGLQEHIRDGNPTNPITPTIVEVDGRKFMLTPVNDDQLLVLGRKLGRHMEQPQVVSLPADTRARQREAARVQVIREFTRLLEG